MIDLKPGFIADRDLAFADLADVHDNVVDALLRIGNCNFSGLGRDATDVTHLAAAFAIERGLVQYHGDVRAPPAETVGLPSTTKAVMRPSALSVS